MMDKKILEAIARLIKKEVDREVEKRLTAMRMEIISEVAGMLNYSERKLLTKLNEHESFRQTETRGMRNIDGESDFERSMKNLKSMPAYRETVSKVASPKKKQYTSNPMLNDLLNETDELSGDEMYDGAPSFMDAFMGGENFTPETREPWTNESKIQPIQSQRAPNNNVAPKTILGTDNRPINLNNEKVQNVLSILNNTDFKAKYDEIVEKGNNFRGMGAPAPRFNSDYFDKTVVD